MKKELLDQLYRYKHSILGEIEKLNERRKAPFDASSSEKLIAILEEKIELKNEQFNMIIKLIDLCFTE